MGLYSFSLVFFFSLVYYSILCLQYSFHFSLSLSWKLWRERRKKNTSAYLIKCMPHLTFLTFIYIKISKLHCAVTTNEIDNFSFLVSSTWNEIFFFSFFFWKSSPPSTMSIDWWGKKKKQIKIWQLIQSITFCFRFQSCGEKLFQ